MMAPGKRTLFLKGRIPSRLGSSTDSAMFATEEKQTVVLQRERERRRRRVRGGEREGGKCDVCGFGFIWFWFGWKDFGSVRFFYFFLNGDGLFFVINTFASFFVFFFFFLYNRYWVLSKGL